jgi:hypothetical protein
VPITL